MKVLTNIGITLTCIVLFTAFAKSVEAATYYVRPSVTDTGCTYGSCNGTSYANAWEGFTGGDGTPINWTTVDADNNNTTLFICGTHAQTFKPTQVGEPGATIKVYSCEIQYGGSNDDAGIINVAGGALYAIDGWTSPFLSNMELKGLTLANSTSQLLRTFSSSNLRIEDMTFNSAGAEAIVIHTVTGLIADNLTVNNPVTRGISITFPVNSSYSNITISNSGAEGFRAQGNTSSTGNTFSDITVNSPGNRGVEFTAFGTAQITADQITVNDASGLTVNNGAIHIFNTSGTLTNVLADRTVNGPGIFFDSQNNANITFTMGLAGNQPSKDIRATNSNFGRSIFIKSVVEAADVTLQNFESSYNQSLSTNEAVMLDTADGVTIRNGWVHHNVQGLYFGTNSDNNIASNIISEYNTVDQLKSSFNSQGNIFEKSIARYGGDSWVAAWQTDTGRAAYGDDGIGVAFHVSAGNTTPNQIRYSQIYGNEGPGIEMTNDTVSYVINNTISQNGYSPSTISLVGGIFVDSTGMASSRIQNNILYDNSPAEIYHTSPNPSTTYLAILNSLDNNQYYHPDDSDQFYVDMTNDSVSNPGYMTWAQYSTAMGSLGSQQERNSQYGNPLFTNLGTSDFTLQTISPAIEQGISISGLTSDYLGNTFYGTVDIGVYEFQPSFSMGTDEIDVAGNVRVYADGRFRNTVAPSGTSSDLSISPSGGYGTGDHSEYMNIVTNNWVNSGNYHKRFTTTLLQPDDLNYTIGDLQPNTLYRARVNGGAWGDYIADVDGRVTLSLNQDDQPNEVEVIKDIAAPTGGVIINSNNPTTATRNVTLTISVTDDFSSLSNLQMMVSNTSDFAGASYESFNTTKSWELTTGSGTKTVYVRFKDQTENVSNIYFDEISYPQPIESITAQQVTQASNNSSTTPIISYPATEIEGNIEHLTYVRLWVMDENEIPIVNAKVIIRDLNIQGLTDENGFINLGSIEKKNYEIEIEYKGNTYRKTLSVSELIETIELDLGESPTNNILSIVVIGIIGAGVIFFVVKLLTDRIKLNFKT